VIRWAFAWLLLWLVVVLGSFGVFVGLL